MEQRAAPMGGGRGRRTALPSLRQPLPSGRVDCRKGAPSWLPRPTPACSRRIPCIVTWHEQRECVSVPSWPLSSLQVHFPLCMSFARDPHTTSHQVILLPNAGSARIDQLHADHERSPRIELFLALLALSLFREWQKQQSERNSPATTIRVGCRLAGRTRTGRASDGILRDLFTKTRRTPSTDSTLVAETEMTPAAFRVN